MKQFVIITILSFCTFVLSHAKVMIDTDSYNYKRGIECLSNQLYDEAINHFLADLEINPKSGNTWKLLSHCYYMTDNYEKMNLASKNALKYIPNSDNISRSGIYDLLSQAHYKQGNIQEAIEHINTAITLYPDNYGYYNNRAIYRTSIQQFDLAKQDYVDMLKLNPCYPYTYSQLGYINTMQGYYQKAIECFNKSLELDNSYSFSYIRRAYLFLDCNLPLYAAKDIIKAIESNNNVEYDILKECNDSCYNYLSILMDIKSHIKDSKVNWNYHLGILHENHDNYLEAIDCYLKSLNKINDAIIYNNIANCYNYINKYDTALHYIDKAIEIDSMDCNLFYSKATYLYNMGEYNNALNYINKFIELEPEISQGYKDKGLYCQFLRKDKEAISALTRYLELNAQDVEAIFLRAESYNNLGDSIAARKDYQKVLESIGDDDVMTLQALAYVSLGQNDVAIKIINHLFSKDEGPDLYYQAACVYARMNNIKQALDYLTTALEKGFTNITLVKNDYNLDNLRKTNEFKELLKKFDK